MKMRGKSSSSVVRGTRSVIIERMQRRARKAVVISLIIIGLSAFILKLFLFYFLMSKCPVSPIVSTGQIYPLNNHGYIFYVTRIHAFLQDILMYAFIIFGFGGALLNLRWKVIRNNFEEMHKHDLKM